MIAPLVRPFSTQYSLQPFSALLAEDRATSPGKHDSICLPLALIWRRIESPRELASLAGSVSCHPVIGSPFLPLMQPRSILGTQKRLDRRERDALTSVSMIA